MVGRRRRNRAGLGAWLGRLRARPRPAAYVSPVLVVDPYVDYFETKVVVDSLRFAFRNLSTLRDFVTIYFIYYILISGVVR